MISRAQKVAGRNAISFLINKEPYRKETWRNSSAPVTSIRLSREFFGSREPKNRCSFETNGVKSPDVKEEIAVKKELFSFNSQVFQKTLNQMKTSSASIAAVDG